MRQPNVGWQAGYAVKDPFGDPGVMLEGQGPADHNREFVVGGQSPSRHGFRDQNRIGRETVGQYARINPAEPGLFGSAPLVRAQPNTGFGLVGDPCQTDRGNSTKT